MVDCVLKLSFKYIIFPDVGWVILMTAGLFEKVVVQTMRSGDLTPLAMPQADLTG